MDQLIDGRIIKRRSTAPSNIAILSKNFTPYFFISNERASLKIDKSKFLVHSMAFLKTYEANTE